MRSATNRLLGHLELEREPPTLDFLHRLVGEHQRRVPFETLSKLIDYEPGLARGDFLPPIEEYVERIVSRGAGGLCWTLARGFHFLLRDLGFDASHMMMHSGHCCVRVELPEGSYYADVGYAAPLYRAYPLFESFTLETPRETFAYDVRPEGIFVTRTPGPAKQLDPTPRRIEDLADFIESANDWNAEMSFLHRLSYGRHLGGVYTALRDGVLTRYLPGGPEKSEVAPEHVPATLRDLFGADPALYDEALAVWRRYRPEKVAP